MKKIIKKISNYLKRPNKNYSTEFKSDSIECEILLGSCPNVYDPASREIIDHLIIRFDYGSDLTKDKDEFVSKCIEKGIYTYQSCNDTNLSLIIASNLLSILNLMKIFYDEDGKLNRFALVCSDELNGYYDNLNDYGNDEISFEFIQHSHKSIRRNALTTNIKDIEIIGYTDIKDIPSYLSCIWLLVTNAVLHEFGSFKSTHAYLDSDVILLKMSLQDFIDLVSISGETIDTDKEYLYIGRDRLEVIFNIINNDNKYFHSLKPSAISDNKHDDDLSEEESYLYDIGEDEEEISQEDFFNAALDEIIRK